MGIEEFCVIGIVTTAVTSAIQYKLKSLQPKFYKSGYTMTIAIIFLYSMHPHLLKTFVHSLASLIYEESSIKFGCGVYFEASSFSENKKGRIV